MSRITPNNNDIEIEDAYTDTEMDTSTQTPPMSRRSSSPSSSSLATSPSRKRHAPNLSIDLSDLPALSQPSPPTNTLIITNLDDPTIFTPTNLAQIRAALDSQDPLYSFSPLKSFRRIICAFHSARAATDVRTKLDGEAVLGRRIRVYFGQETKILSEHSADQHLKAPQPQKLFFISPPPSPPHGWEVRNEDPPNKEVHAEDLVNALHQLSAVAPPPPPPPSGRFAEHVEHHVADEGHQEDKMDICRQRSDSRTIVYHPVEQGHSPDLPAIAVEDTSASPSPVSPTFDFEGNEKKPITHTARPPVELME